MLEGFATLLSSGQQAASLRSESRELKFQADVEEHNAKVTENDLREQLARTLASNNAAAAASGIYGGSVGAAALDDIAVASRAIKARNLEAMFRAGSLRRGAKNLRREARTVQVAGVLSAFASFGSDAAKAATAGTAG